MSWICEAAQPGVAGWDGYRCGRTQHGFGRANHSSQRVAQSVEARGLLLRLVLMRHTHTHRHTQTERRIHTHTHKVRKLFVQSCQNRICDSDLANQRVIYGGADGASVVLVGQRGRGWRRWRRSGGGHLGVQQGLLGGEAGLGAAQRLDGVVELQEGELLAEQQDAAGRSRRGRSNICSSLNSQLALIYLFIQSFIYLINSRFIHSFIPLVIY